MHPEGTLHPAGEGSTVCPFPGEAKTHICLSSPPALYTGPSRAGREGLILLFSSGLCG